MKVRFGWVLMGVMACTSATTAEEPAEPVPASVPEPAPESVPEPAQPTTTPPTTATVSVQMTAATLADDCGQGAAQAKAKAKEKRSGPPASARMAKGSVACQQTSMQLSVVAAADSPQAQLSVTKVELFDDKGALLGELTARSPSVWGEDGTYQPWDEGIAGGQELSVSYPLSQPPWGDVSDRRNRTYVLKASLTVNGDEQLVEHEVKVAAPTILPPGVKT